MRPLLGSLCLAAIIAVPRVALAQARPTPTPGPACSTARAPVYASVSLMGALHTAAVLPQGNSLWIATRMLPPAGARRFGSRVVLTRIEPDATTSYGPRVVAQSPGSDTGPVVLTLPRDATADTVPAVWLARGVTAVRVQPLASTAAPGTDPTAVFRSPVRGMQAPPLLATDAPGEGDGSVTLVWRRSEHTWSQRVALTAEPALLRAQHFSMPGRTITVAAARTHEPEETLVLVARTSARRYVLARALPTGRLAWTGLGPAGCDRGRCPAVSLTPAHEGVLAHWFGRQAPDRLAQLGARALTDQGHPRGAPREFLPMAEPVAIAGPVGEPFAVQLGHPSVLRGTRRPIALPTFAGPMSEEARDEHERPSRAMSYVDPEGALNVVLLARDGALSWHSLRCEGARTVAAQ